MTTYVLVHGGWHGGWCWKRVTPYLLDAGHTVYTPTLTGLGERSHLASQEINLSTHIQDILNVLIYEDLTDVVLVGHSYSGMVIAGVADRAPERVTGLVFLDAFVPEDGQSLRDILRPPYGEGVDLEALLVDGWRLPYPFLERPFGITSEVDKQWVLDKITPQPINTLLEAVRFTNGGAPQSREPTFISGLREGNLRIPNLCGSRSGRGRNPAGNTTSWSAVMMR